MRKKLITSIVLVSFCFGIFAAVAVPQSAEAIEDGSVLDVVTSAGQGAILGSPFGPQGMLVGAAGATLIELSKMIPSRALESTVAWTMDRVMWVMARGLWMAGKIFDYSVDWGLNFSKILNQVPVVESGWKVLRDIANIAFIFIALWSGISIILGINAEKAWGLLAHMVLVALFINFSLFITKTVIDASNIAALHFYRLMVASPCPDTPENCKDAKGNDRLPQLGISVAFMNGLKLQTLYNSELIGKENGTSAVGSAANAGTIKAKLNPLNIILIGVFGSIFMLIAAFVFFAAACMFVIRTVTLMLLMLLSPLAFVAWLLPGAQGFANEWWHKLWSQSFFAPLYMALAYVVVATIQDDRFSAYLTGASFAAELTSDGSSPSSIPLIFNFVIMSALLIGCLLVAQKLGASGSGMMMKMMKLGGKLAGGTSGATGRFMVRGTYLSAAGGVAKGVGWAVQKVGMKKLGDRLYSGGAALDKVQKKIDVGELDKRFGRTMFGKTAIGNIIREQTTGRLVKAKFGGEKSVHEAYEEDERLREARNQIKKRQDAEQAYGRLEVAKRGGDPAKIREAEGAVYEAVNKISPTHFADMTEHQIKSLIKYTSFSQVKAVSDAKQWTQDEKEEMIKKRWESGFEEFTAFERLVEEFEEKRKHFNELARDPKLLSDPTRPIKLKKDGSLKYIDKDGFATDKKGGVITDKAGNKLKPPIAPRLPSHLQTWAEKQISLPEYIMMANIMPEIFKLKTFGRSISFNNTHRELRRNENISPGLREEFSLTKDSKVIDKLIDERGPWYMPKTDEGDREKAYSAALVAAREAAKAAKVAAVAAGRAATASAEAKQAFNKSFNETYAEGTPADTLRLAELREWSAGRSSDELGNGRGKVRRSEPVSQVTTPKVLQTLAGRDLLDLQAGIQHLVTALRDEEKGKGLMTETARDTLKWLVGQTSQAKQMPKPDDFRKKDGSLDVDLQNFFRTLLEKGATTKDLKIGIEVTRENEVKKLP